MTKANEMRLNFFHPMHGIPDHRFSMLPFFQPEVTEVPNEFKMTDEDFFAEFAASSCFSRKSTVAPRSLSVGDGGMASTSTPLRGRSARRAVTLNLEIPKSSNTTLVEGLTIQKD